MIPSASKVREIIREDCTTLGNDERLDVFLVIADRERASFTEIMSSKSLTPAKLASHLARLIRSKLIEQDGYEDEGDRKVKMFKASNKGSSLVANIVASAQT